MSPADRRSAIVDAALAVARAKGLGATTVRDVASEMGTSSGLIHHYFESMDDVLAAAFERAAGADLADATSAVEQREDALGRLEAFFATYAPAHDDWTMQLWLDAWAEAARRPALQEVSRTLNRGWQQLVESIIRLGVEEGAFTCEDPGAIAWRVLSLLDGLVLQVVAHGAVLSRDTVLRWAEEAARRELSVQTTRI
jgi:AcrR family transcriptional regulator